MDQTRKNEIIAVGLFAMSLFLFLSLFTFTEQDLSFYTSNPNISIQNATGIIGSFVGGLLHFFIGGAAYVFPVLVLVWGASRLLQTEPRKLFFKFFGTIVLVTAVSASLSMISDSSPRTAFESGGLLGTIVSAFLVEYLGRVGAAVFIIALIILSVLIATEFLILPIVLAIANFLKGLHPKIKAYLRERGNEEGSSVKSMRKSKLKAAREEMARKLEVMKQQVEATRNAPVVGKERPAKKPLTGPQIVTSGKIKKASSKPAREASPSSGVKTEKYVLPSLDLLNSQPKLGGGEREEVLKRKAAILEKTLLDFDVEAKVVKINRGPVITMFELEPAVGTKVNRITSLADNIALSMKSANIRIVAPLPGKGTIGIEVPNSKCEMVYLKNLLESVEYAEERAPLKLAIGQDISGDPIVTDLAKMPHLLIAGATGSGKTVCINAIICSLLFNLPPDELKFLMIDPKRVELMIFEKIPHLVSPIVTNPKKAAAALNWVVEEMDKRYEIFADNGVRNIAAFKEKRAPEDKDLPYIVVVVDELADLMMVGQQDVEGAIMRIAQLSRAAGIHMILATQRPSVNVITGVVKANFPARISFKVASKVDSRTVLDANGAEKLLGRGDMLLVEPGEPALIRGQCSLVEDTEIKNVVKFIREQAAPQYSDEAISKLETKKSGVKQDKDDLYMEAVEMVIGTKQASVSMVQRKLRVGYTRAARMIDIMEDEGIVGPHNGSKPREILIDDIKEIGENNDGDE